MKHEKNISWISLIKVIIPLVLFPAGLIAQTDLAVRFSPVVGDTLDAFERDELELFPDVDEFLWAVFLVNESGGNLKAKICSIFDGRRRLQIVNMGFTPGFVIKKIEMTFGQEVQMSVRSIAVERAARLVKKTPRIPNPGLDSVIIVSPRVGDEIDLDERNRFGLFSSFSGFVRAVFFRTPDMAYYALLSIQGDEGTTKDTCVEFTEQVLHQLSERVDHYEDLLAGTYKKKQEPEKGSVEAVITRRKWSSEKIPLANNTANLVRPIFGTIHLDIGVGFTFCDLSGVRPLILGKIGSPGYAPADSVPESSSGKIAIPLSFLLHFPLSDDPSISFIGGWGFAVGGVGSGGLTAFSALIVFESHSVFFPFDPIVGFGIGRTSFSQSQGIIIDASVSYPIVVLGANIVPNFLNVVLTLPIVQSLTTTFESQSYSIRPAGPAFILEVCL